jgi:hypothetical protein
MHFKTFSILEQDATAFVRLVKKITKGQVIKLNPGEAIEV